MSGDSYEVAPLSRAAIRTAARELRRVNCALAGRTEDRPYFDIFRFLDVVLPKYFEDFTVEILPVSEMWCQHGDAHALTIPVEQSIVVREDIWERAELGRGRDRSTLAHELGHLILHRSQTFARKIAGTRVSIFRQSEWQAKAFAGELLMSADFIDQCSSADAAAEIFGVSVSAAETQWSAFKRDGII